MERENRAKHEKEKLKEKDNNAVYRERRISIIFYRVTESRIFFDNLSRIRDSRSILSSEIIWSLGDNVFIRELGEIRIARLVQKP